MLNIVWPIFVIISFSYGIFSGNLENLNSSVFNSVNDAINLTISLLGTMCLWCGIMQIANKTSVIDKLTKILKPLIRIIFPKINTKIEKEISMNMIANILGLGNAATPLGLKAMKSMQEENPKKEILSDSMLMFIIINTASIQIIPTTVIAIRNSMGSSNPTAIVVPIWIASVITATAGIIITKIFIKLDKKEKK